MVKARVMAKKSAVLKSSTWLFISFLRNILIRARQWAALRQRSCRELCLYQWMWLQNGPVARKPVQAGNVGEKTCISLHDIYCLRGDNEPELSRFLTDKSS